MDPEVSFGTWVAQRRKKLDLTRAEVARCAGCSVPGLRKIESDERRPSRQLAERLAECLQIPPDQRSLFLEIARGERCVERLGSPLPGAKPAPIHQGSNLPLPPAPLIGREAELAMLARLLRDPECRLLTLVGSGGIGKTRLAIAASSREQALFPDGIYFVSLASLTSPQFVVPAIADALGFTFSGPAEPKIQLKAYLREKCLLLVLDNMEHLLEAGALLAELLQQAPKIKLLVTSREQLNLQGEWLFDLQGLPVPPPDQVEGAERYSAVGLFVQSARRVQAGFELKAEDRPAVSRICQMVEGMPLAIELAAAWVAVLTCQEIAREIEHNLDFLVNATRDAPGRHHSLRATFDHSWNLLGADERQVLSRLAVFQGGFEQPAAESIAGATLLLLRALTSKSLVRRMKGGRYDLHEVVRQYALTHLADEPQAEAATRERHSDFYLALLRDREMALKSAAQPETMRALTDELDNVRAAWAWAIKHEKFGLLGSALRCLGLLFNTGGWLDEGIEQLDRLVQALHPKAEDKERRKVLGQALAQQGLLFFRKGQFDQAQHLLEESLTLLRPLGDPALLTDPLIINGIITHLNGMLDQARLLMNEGLVCAQAAGDLWFTAYARFNLGYMASVSGCYAEGYEQMLVGLAMWRKLGDPSAIALGLNYISPTAILLGRYEEAQTFLQESLALSTEAGDRWGMGTAYRNLGLTALAQGHIPKAQYLLHKSLDIFTNYVTGWDIVRSLLYLGKAAAAGGDCSEARRIFVETLPMAVEIGALPLAMEALVGLAHLQAHNGEAEQALELLICVLNHPASTHETKNCARDLCSKLETQLAPQQIEAAWAQVKMFETIVKEITSE